MLHFAMPKLALMWWGTLLEAEFLPTEQWEIPPCSAVRQKIVCSKACAALVREMGNSKQHCRHQAGVLRHTLCIAFRYHIQGVLTVSNSEFTKHGGG